MTTDSEELDRILDDWSRKYFEPVTTTRGQGGLPLHGTVNDWQLTITKNGWKRYKDYLKEILLAYTAKKVKEARIDEVNKFKKNIVVGTNQLYVDLRIYIKNRLAALRTER